MNPQSNEAMSQYTQLWRYIIVIWRQKEFLWAKINLKSIHSVTLHAQNHIYVLQTCLPHYSCIHLERVLLRRVEKYYLHYIIYYLYCGRDIHFSPQHLLSQHGENRKFYTYIDITVTFIPEKRFSAIISHYLHKLVKVALFLSLYNVGPHPPPPVFLGDRC